jgi:hypothetical protein
LKAGRSASQPAAYIPRPRLNGTTVHSVAHSSHRSFRLVYRSARPMSSSMTPGMTIPARSRRESRENRMGTRKNSEPTTSSRGHHSNRAESKPFSANHSPIQVELRTMTPVTSSMRPTVSSRVRLIRPSIGGA